MRYYAYNGDGQVQLRREGTIKNGQFVQDGAVKPNYLYAYAGGQQMAQITEGSRIVSLNGVGMYQAGGAKVVALAGETLRTLAQRIYGNDLLWYVLAEANGLGEPDQEIGGGRELTAPRVDVSRNDANTFKPYDPGEAIGSTMPGLPYIPPAPGAKCGAMSKVISVIVTAVVSYFAGGAGGAAAGNYAGQMSQLMFNGQYDWGRALRLGLNPFGGNSSDLARSVYDPGSHGAPGRIDYKSIAVSAASAAATNGISQYASYLGLSTASSIALQTVATTAANYQFNKWAGYDVSWSNRQLGANLLSAGISAGIATKWGTTADAFADGKPLTTAGIAISNGLVRSAVGKLVSNIPFNWSDIATSAITDFARDGLTAALRSRLSDTVSNTPPASAEESWTPLSPFATGSGLIPAPESDLMPWEGLGGFDLGTGLSFASGTPSSATLQVDQDSRPAVPKTQKDFGTHANGAGANGQSQGKQYISDLNSYLVGRGMRPMDNDITPEGAAIRYLDLTDGEQTHDIGERVTVTAPGATEPATFTALDYRNLGSGIGYGVTRNDFAYEYAERTGELPVSWLEQKERRDAELRYTYFQVKQHVDDRQWQMVNTFFIGPLKAGTLMAVSPLAAAGYGLYEATNLWSDGHKKTAVVVGGLSALGLRASLVGTEVKEFFAGYSAARFQLPVRADSAVLKTSHEFFAAYPIESFKGSLEARSAWKVYKDTSTDPTEIVMGRLEDTAVGAELGMQRLNAPAWNPQINDAWVQGGIDASRKFYLASPIRFNTLRSGDPLYPTTVFMRELKMLRGAGYSRQGDYMIPPSNPPPPRIIQGTVAAPLPKPAYTPDSPLRGVSWYPFYGETEQ
ncbi:hypothetical protein RDV84_14305 [Lysobacter yananisis]|uniref:LysM domain-containing protein n=1 Tax=Lysobacter yananisis TaxID=1003114 RepID=A0ABY9P2I0_9GAMM|nr:hypothetical protein [Lysobacter yananisis]WMT01169.1 hypothetical protein RDV84_14305 [Lysobacter yananisis]